MTLDELKYLVAEIFGYDLKTVEFYSYRFTVLKLPGEDISIRWTYDKFKCYADDYEALALPVQISFEHFFELCPPEIQKRLLFHLDLFE